MEMEISINERKLCPICEIDRTGARSRAMRPLNNGATARHAVRAPTRDAMLLQAIGLIYLESLSFLSSSGIIYLWFSLFASILSTASTADKPPAKTVAHTAANLNGYIMSM